MKLGTKKKTKVVEEVPPLEDTTPWSLAYEAYAENPRVFVTVAGDPATCLREMADLLEAEDLEMWCAASVSFDDDGHYLVVYI
jgi:hypothetical protein